jgi:hypothetical protein
VRRTKQTSKYTSWILLSGFLMLMAWKCEQRYREYRSSPMVLILWLRPATPLMSNRVSSFTAGTTKMYRRYIRRGGPACD